MMLSEILVLLGAITMAFAFTRCKKCVDVLPEYGFKKHWKQTTTLVAIFIAAYIFYLFVRFTNSGVGNERLIVGLILFHGSIFVLLVTTLHHLAFTEILGLQQETQSYAESLEEEVRKRTKRLEELTLTDSITGLYNKRFFFKKLNEELARAIRYRTPLCLLVFDIDQCDSYDGTMDRNAGERILQAISNVMRQQIRDKVDICSRYGNTAFSIILPNTAKKPALDAALRLLKELNKEQISISVGLIPCGGSGTSDASSLLKLAEMAARAARHEGGNRIKLVYLKPAQEHDLRKLG